MNHADADVLFRSMGDPGRRLVARILAETPLTVGEITEVLGLPQSTVSRHLKSLRATGLLIERRERNRVYIGLLEPVGNGDGDLTQVLNAWLRRQPLASAVEGRLREAVQNRNGSVDAFERLAHQWDELRFEHFGSTFHLEAVASLLPTDWRVLDVGTGTGYMLPFLARQFREVVAADASPAMLDLARQRAEREGLANIEFELGRLEDLPVPGQSIDCALAILVLRHSADLDLSLGELARVLVNGGRLVVVDLVPHGMEEFRLRIGDASNGIALETVQEAMERSGFSIVERRVLRRAPADSPTGPTRPAPDMFLITAERGSRNHNHQ